MRVRLKGINAVKKRLADGTLVTYHYAWKGGPRVDGKPGSPEFVASYNAAVANKRRPPEGVVFSLLAGYQASGDFRNLAPRTRADYVKQIKKIEAEFGDFPLAAMTDRRTRGEFLVWRDRMSEKSTRQADYTFTVLALILAWAKDRGLISVNPCERAGRLYRGSRAERVWTADDEKAFMAKAPPQFHLALQLALWTGQRQGDLLALTWFQYDGHKIRLQQGKTGARVAIPVGAPLKATLDALKAARNAKPGDHVLLTSRAKPWTSGFGSAFKKASVSAGIVGLTFHDTRGTAVTRLARCGCTVPEIATFTGHSLKDAQAILDAHYLDRDPALAESAARKLERGTETSN